MSVRPHKGGGGNIHVVYILYKLYMFTHSFIRRKGSLSISLSSELPDLIIDNHNLLRKSIFLAIIFYSSLISGPINVLFLLFTLVDGTDVESARTTIDGGEVKVKGSRGASIASISERAQSTIHEENVRSIGVEDNDDDLVNRADLENKPPKFDEEVTIASLGCLRFSEDDHRCIQEGRRNGSSPVAALDPPLHFIPLLTPAYPPLKTQFFVERERVKVRSSAGRPPKSSKKARPLPGGSTRLQGKGTKTTTALHFGMDRLEWSEDVLVRNRRPQGRDPLDCLDSLVAFATATVSGREVRFRRHRRQPQHWARCPSTSVCRMVHGFDPIERRLEWEMSNRSGDQAPIGIRSGSQDVIRRLFRSQCDDDGGSGDQEAVGKQSMGPGSCKECCCTCSHKDVLYLAVGLINVLVVQFVVCVVFIVDL